MGKYIYKKISNDTHLLNDEDLCTVYIIEGSSHSLVIDTGMKSNNNLLDEIRKFTTKPLFVVLTHTHFDHLGHINEFDEYYVCIDEKNGLIKNNIDIDKAIFFDDEYEFDLGNKKVKAKVFKGHTKGSTILFDEDNKFIFTGDQFGSGCGVWMQVLEATTISEYKESIDNFLNYLNTNYSFSISDWTFWGGHLGQEHTSRLNIYNPLNIDLIQNMAILCELLLKDNIVYQNSNAKSFTGEPSYYVNYKTAEMIIRKSLVK